MTMPPDPGRHRADDSDLDARREAMIDIVASWDLDGARPSEAGMAVVRSYVAGEIDLDEMIRRMASTNL
ncbi:antitoxin VbhA family protein [Serinibacter arcticus]|uniref:antitoxin VbhA family protein n=1 Tax=Serinibacter arcticus TaxID=1655435 RepID=UPI0011B25310|nr:antitoxin VbhA family protein [Serinibacter arcticus]